MVSVVSAGAVVRGEEARCEEAVQTMQALGALSEIPKQMWRLQGGSRNKITVF